MDDVEPLALEHPRDEPLQSQRERDAADRAVVGDRDRLSDLDDILGGRVVAPRRGDDPHVMTEPPQLLVALPYVRIRAARPGIRVWRDDADLHPARPGFISIRSRDGAPAGTAAAPSSATAA